MSKHGAGGPREQAPKRLAAVPRDADGPFGLPDYRRQWGADLATSCAFEMETLALAWYVLQATGSVVLMAAIGALQYLGTLVAPLVGVAGDRLGLRNIMLAMRLFYLLVAAVIAVCAAAGWMTPWLALGLAAVSGLLRPSDHGLRNVVTSKIVPDAMLLGALGLSRLTVDMARIAGALTGAVFMAALGMAWAYALVVSCYALACLLTAMLSMDAKSAHRPATSAFAHLRSAFRSVLDSPAQGATMAMAFLVNLTAFPFMLGLLPYVAKDKFGMDELGLGLLIACAASGCMAASFLLARIRLARPAVAMLASSIIWHLLVVAFGFAPSLPVALVLLFLAGVAQNFCMVPMAVFLLGNVSPELRGGVAGLRAMAIYGLPLGLMITGQALGSGMSFAAVSGVSGAIGVLATGIVWRLGSAHFGPMGRGTSSR